MDAGNQGTGGGIPWLNQSFSFTGRCGDEAFLIQAEIRFSRFGIRAMAGKTTVRKDGIHIACEIDGSSHLGLHGMKDRQETKHEMRDGME